MNIESRIYTMNDFWFTIARSLFNYMKRLGCLVHLSPFISLGRKRGCYRALARMVACPLWDSQSVVSQGMGAPFTSSRRAQMRCPRLPHDFPPIWSSYLWGPWTSSTAWRPFEAPPHLPPSPRLTFSSLSLERPSI